MGFTSKFVIVSLSGALLLSACGGSNPNRKEAIDGMSSELDGELSPKEAKCFAEKTVDGWLGDSKDDFTAEDADEVIALGKKFGDFDEEARKEVAADVSEDQLKAVEDATAECVDDLKDRIKESAVDSFSETLPKSTAECIPDEVIKKFSDEKRLIEITQFYSPEDDEKVDYSEAELSDLTDAFKSCLDDPKKDSIDLMEEVFIKYGGPQNVAECTSEKLDDWTEDEVVQLTFLEIKAEEYTDIVTECAEGLGVQNGSGAETAELSQ